MGNIPKHLSVFLQNQLSLKGMSVRRMSALAKVSPGFWARVIRGERNPPRDEMQLNRVGSVLGLKPDMISILANRIPQRYLKEITKNPEKLSSLVKAKNYRSKGKNDARSFRKKIDESRKLRNEDFDVIL